MDPVACGPDLWVYSQGIFLQVEGMVMRRLFAAAIAAVLFAGCASSYRVILSNGQTDTEHWLMIDDFHGPGERLLDCYSKQGDKWVPVCKEVQVIRR